MSITMRPITPGMSIRVRESDNFQDGETESQKRARVEEFLRDLGRKASDGNEEFGEALRELICCTFSGPGVNYWDEVDEWLQDNYPGY